LGQFSQWELAQSLDYIQEEFKMAKDKNSSKLVAIAYEGRETASEVLHEIQALQAAGDVVLEDAVIVERQQGTQVEIKQVQTPEWKSTKRGGGIGLIAGLLLGGPIVGVMAGAGLGYMSGKLRDHGIPDKFIENLSASLKPDSSAIFLLVKEANAEKVLATLKPFQGHVLSTTLDDEQEERLRRTLG
jgi:uncharacterized membrane protein